MSADLHGPECADLSAHDLTPATMLNHHKETQAMNADEYTPNDAVNDSPTLTHAAIMLAIRDADPARSAATLRDYASECDRVLATELATELRGYANARAPIAPEHGLSAHDLTPATTTGAQHRATVDAIRSAPTDTLCQILDGRIPAARGYGSAAANELNKRQWALSVATPSVHTATQSVFASLTDDGWTYADALAVARRVRYALCCDLPTCWCGRVERDGACSAHPHIGD